MNLNLFICSIWSEISAADFVKCKFIIKSNWVATSHKYKFITLSIWAGVSDKSKFIFLINFSSLINLNLFVRSIWNFLQPSLINTNLFLYYIWAAGSDRYFFSFEQFQQSVESGKNRLICLIDMSSKVWLILIYLSKQFEQLSLINNDK